ncbi:MAG TPA: tripartite tricarboxylate transporter substrate-binding protein [Reyranella sp.]
MSAGGATWSPSRDLEIVAGTPPGGGLDRAARALVKAIEVNKLASVPVRVVNVPGDGARAAWKHIDKYAGDAHVVSISSPNLTTDKLVGLAKFDQRDYSPLSILYTEYIAFIAKPDSPVASAKAFLNALSTAPGKLTISLSTTLGNPNHIAVAQVAVAAKADPMTPVIRTFDTALDVIADVIVGNADVGAVTVASVVKEQTAGNIKTFAISSPERLEGMFADSPTWLEFDVDCIIGAWRGVTGPKGLDEAQKQYWRELMQKATATSTWTDELAAHHWAEMYVDGEALERDLERERNEYTAQLTSLGLIKN